MCPISVRCGIGFIPFDIAVKRAVYSVKAKRMVESLANGERALIGLTHGHNVLSTWCKNIRLLHYVAAKIEQQIIVKYSYVEFCN